MGESNQEDSIKNQNDLFRQKQSRSTAFCPEQSGGFPKEPEELLS